MSDLKIDMKMQSKKKLIYQTDFIFALISRHFIGLVRYFTGRRELCQRKKTCLNKLIKIQIWISLNRRGRGVYGTTCKSEIQIFRRGGPGPNFLRSRFYFGKCKLSIWAVINHLGSVKVS